jgi:gas vesicle protein
MIDIIKNKIIASLLIGGFLIGAITVFIGAMNKIAELRAENKQLQEQLQSCKNLNKDLVNQIRIQQSEYVKAQKQLQEAYNKPAKRVYIKQTIKEPVYITNEDCQRMVDLINQTQEQLK